MRRGEARGSRRWSLGVVVVELGCHSCWTLAPAVTLCQSIVFQAWSLSSLAESRFDNLRKPSSRFSARPVA